MKRNLTLLLFCGCVLGVLAAATSPSFLSGGYTPNINDPQLTTLQRILGFVHANAAANTTPGFLQGHTPNVNDPEPVVLQKILGALIDGGGGGGGGGSSSGIVAGFTNTANTVVSVTSLAGTSIDPTTATWFVKTLSADTTFTFANLANGQEWNVVIIQDASHTVTWPGTVNWIPSVAQPTMDTGAGVVNVFTFKQVAGTVYGDVSQRTAASVASDNWVASGTTNSQLYGVASVNGLVVTNTSSIGTATATTVNKVAITAPASSATLTIANGKTLTANNTLTLAGTDSTTMTFPSTSATIARTDAANTFTGNQTISGTAQATRLGLGITPDATRILAIEMDGLGATVNAGIVLSNATAAAAGAQQYSPGIYLQGQGWKTAATAASQSVEARIYNTPVQGSSAPTGSILFDFSINGGAFGNAAFLTSAGVMTATTVASTSATTAGGSSTVGTTFIVSGRSKWGSPGDGAAIFVNNASNAVATLQYSRPCSTKTANYTIVALDSGTAFNNIGAVATNRLDLPTAAVGMHFYFYVDAAQNMQIQATGTDTIRSAATVSAAAGDIHSSTVGSTLHLYCPKLTLWIVDTITGTWVGPT